ncbi:MAG: hypothetical protein CMM44_11585 [Rhodospirillaceae bacterium]|nr:hypothetical protein [Rhodospirillaceae bacterium]|tara:strand:+ start:697 stop:1524 length:828 start_codon:yes stop_codon:yes gene_type:complete
MNICIGTAQIGSKYGVTNSEEFDLNTVDKFLSLALRDKNNFIDTAHNYKSEKIIGKFKKLDKFNVISKISLSQLKINEKNIETKINKILNNLKLKKIYALLIHDSFLFTKKELKYIFEILNNYNTSYFQKIGISIYDPRDYYRFKNISEINIIQFPLNILDQRFINLLDDMKNNNIEVHARSIFLQGKLIDSSNSTFTDLMRVDNYVKKNKYNKLDFSIKFIKNFKNIDKIVCGFNSIQHYREVVKSINKNQIKSKIDYSVFKSNNRLLIDPRKW